MGGPAADKSVKADTVARFVSLDDDSRKRPSTTETKRLVAAVMAEPRNTIVCWMWGLWSSGVLAARPCGRCFFLGAWLMAQVDVVAFETCFNPDAHLGSSKHE
jgi:hypothetical protein